LNPIKGWITHGCNTHVKKNNVVPTSAVSTAVANAGEALRLKVFRQNLGGNIAKNALAGIDRASERIVY
jgi:hypothetical protein